MLQSPPPVYISVFTWFLLGITSLIFWRRKWSNQFSRKSQKHLWILIKIFLSLRQFWILCDLTCRGSAYGVRFYSHENIVMKIKSCIRLFIVAGLMYKIEFLIFPRILTRASLREATAVIFSVIEQSFHFIFVFSFIFPFRKVHNDQFWFVD